MQEDGVNCLSHWWETDIKNHCRGGDCRGVASSINRQRRLWMPKFQPEWEAIFAIRSLLLSNYYLKWAPYRIRIRNVYCWNFLTSRDASTHTYTFSFIFFEIIKRVKFLEEMICRRGREDWRGEKNISDTLLLWKTSHQQKQLLYVFCAMFECEDSDLCQRAKTIIPSIWCPRKTLSCL